MRTHFRLNARHAAVACGRDVPLYRSTDRHDNVDCARCRATDRFKASAAARESRMNVAAMAVNEGDIANAVSKVVVYTQEAVTAMLDSIFETAHDEAENQGVCDTYNEIMEVVEGSVPGWYKMPERKRSWSLYVNSDNRYTDAMTKDELIQAIKDNPEDYINIEAS